MTTIEISLSDLLHLAETASTNGSSIVFMTHTSDGKRASLLVTAEPRRRHRARPAAPKTAGASTEKP